MSTFWQDLIERLRSGQVTTPEEASHGDLVHCIQTIVVPALEAARETLEGEGYTVTLDTTDTSAILKVVNQDGSHAFYSVEGRLYHYTAFAFPMLHGRKDRPKFAKLHIETNGGAHGHRCNKCSVEQLRDECLEICRKWLVW